ncbi:Initiation factor 4A-like protein [Citrus sinensis]|nr:Initiation factor 4A-like protein [Citrus sinensis]
MSVSFTFQETLVELLHLVVAGRRPGLPMIVCCSSRDELDAVCSAVSNLADISFSSLHSDLAETERTLILEEFRHTAMKWSQKVTEQSGDESETGKDEHKSHMIVVTDACLPLLSSGESAISARVLINYELPTKKETYIRRMTTCLAADGSVINIVVGGEVVTLRSMEESLGLIVAEVPINQGEILLLFYKKQ